MPALKLPLYFLFYYQPAEKFNSQVSKMITLTSHPVQDENSPPFSWNHKDSGPILFHIKTHGNLLELT